MPKNFAGGKVENSINQTIDPRAKDFLTESEIKKFLAAAKRG